MAQKELFMFILAEFTGDLKDNCIENLLPHIYGIRFLGIKIHFVKGKFSDIYEVKKRERIAQ